MVKTSVIAAIGGGAAAAAIIVVLVVFNINVPKYQLSVEPDAEMEMSMYVTHLKIRNTGSSELTNIKADYGQTSDQIPVLEPGQMVSLSPPASARDVTVTCDQGISVTKEIPTMGS